MDGKKIVDRYTRLKLQQYIFRSRWSLLAKMFAPTRFGLLQEWTVTPGMNLLNDVYDSTGHFAADLLGNFLSGKIIARGEKWLGVRASNPEVAKDHDVKEWCEESRDRLLADYGRSNFYPQATEMIKDLGVFATGSMYGAERPQLPQDKPSFGYRGSYFACQPIGRYVIGENAIGEVDTHMCELKLTAHAAAARWPKGASQDVLSAAEKDKDKEFDYIYAIFPRVDEDKRMQFGAKAMPWASVYIEKDSGHIAEESGFYELNITVPRYGKRWGEFYGRGFGELALHDAQTLNLAKRMGFEDWALKIRPPIIARDNSVTGTLRFRPAGLVSVNTHNQPIQNVIQPWQTGSHPEVSQIKEQELRMSIQQIFYVSQILKLLEIENLKEMTATAYLQTLNLLFGLLAPLYSSLEAEFLRPRVEADFFRLFREGMFSQPPDLLIETGGDVHIEFQNPLSRAQRLGELDAIDAALARLSPLANAEMQMKGYSEAFDWIDIDKTANKIFDVTGTPTSIIKSEKEVMAVRQARTEQQKAKMQQEQLQLAGDTISKVAPALKSATSIRATERIGQQAA